MKQIKVPVIILVAVAVVYGAAKGYVYLQAKSAMDKLNEQAALFANINYQGISSDLLQGSVAVQGISVTPVTLEESVTIREISVKGDGPMFLFTGAAEMAEQKSPKFLQIRVNGLEADLNGQLFSSYATMAAQSRSVTAPVKSCEIGGVMAASDFQNLGVDQLSADMMMQISTDERSGKTDMNADFDVEDMGSFSFDAKLNGPATPAGMMMGPAPQEINFSWSVTPEYMAKVNTYCANQLGMSVIDYIEYLVNADEKTYVKYYGFVPGKAIRDAVKGFLVKPDTIQVRLLPSPNMNPMTVQDFDPQSVIDLLGLHLYVNNKEVKPLEFSFGEELSQLFGNQSTKKETSKASKPEKPKSSYVFQQTSLTRLPGYVGAQVKVYQQDGMLREGTLVALNKDEAQIEQRLQGGKFSVFIPLENIKRVEVLRLKKQ